MRKLLLAMVLVVVGASAGAGLVFAAGAVVQSHEWEGGGSGSGCGTRYFTTEDPFDVEEENGDFDTLTPAATAHLGKRCSGAAVATFSTEYQQLETEEVGIQSHDDLEVVLRATCTHPALGVPNPCVAGETAYGEPGGEDDPVLMRESADTGNAEVLSMQWVFPSLRPGAWTIDVLAGEGEDLQLGFRTLFVETL